MSDELPPPTDAEVERLQALDAAATPPPWECVGDEPVHMRPADAALVAAMRNLLPRLLEERQILRAALLSVEWGGSVDGWKACPGCGVVEGTGHEGGCVVAKALGRLTAPG